LNIGDVLLNLKINKEKLLMVAFWVLMPAWLQSFGGIFKAEAHLQHLLHHENIKTHKENQLHPYFLLNHVTHWADQIL
jgi:hypothetical protein